MAPAGCQTHWHASRETLQNMIISYITYITSHLGHITSQNPCKNKLDASKIVVANFTWLGAFGEEPFLIYEQKPQRWYKCYQITVVNWILTMVGETDTRTAAYQVRNQSRVSLRVMSVRAASSHHPARCKVHESETTTKASTPTNPLCSTRATDLRIKTALIPL